MSDHHRQPPQQRISGQGTASRPWVVDELEVSETTTTTAEQQMRRSSYERYLAQRRAQQQQQQQQQALDFSATTTTATTGRSSHYSSNSNSSHRPRAAVVRTDGYSQYQNHQRLSLSAASSSEHSSSFRYPNQRPAPPASASSLSASSDHPARYPLYDPVPVAGRGPPSSAAAAARDSSSSSSSIVGSSRQKLAAAAAPSLMRRSVSESPTFRSNTNNDDAAEETTRMGRDESARQLRQARWKNTTPASTTTALANNNSSTTTATANPATTTTRPQQQQPHPLHFQAHDAAVEKYLQRKGHYAHLRSHSQPTTTTPTVDPAAAHHHDDDDDDERQRRRRRMLRSSSSSNNNNRSNDPVVAAAVPRASVRAPSSYTSSRSGMSSSHAAGSDGGLVEVPPLSMPSHGHSQQTQPLPNHPPARPLPQQQQQQQQQLQQPRNPCAYQRPAATAGVVVRGGGGDVLGAGQPRPGSINRRVASEGGAATATSATLRNSEAALYDSDAHNNNNNNNAAAVVRLDNNTNKGWSTIKPSSRSGLHNMTTAAVLQHEEYKAQTAAAAAAMTSGAATTSSSKVDEYLARRNRMKDINLRLMDRRKEPIPPPPVSTVHSAESIETGAVVPSPPGKTFSHVDSSPDESSESDNEVVELANSLEEDDSDHDDVGQKEWSVKVCVISAVDFPDSVVPNLPFSPVFKLGMVRLQSTKENPQGEEAGTTASRAAALRHSCSAMATIIEKDGLASISNARLRCTSSKILSKRDNGSVEFHEEMRWDGIRRPEQMALVLELSSLAVLTPANVRESPPAQNVGPFQFPSTTPTNTVHRRTATTSSPSKGTSATTDAISGLGSLFQKLRRSDSSEMEEANAAAAVAKLLVQGDAPSSTSDSQTGSTGPLFDNKPPNLKAVAGNQSEMDVKLRRRKRKRTRTTNELRIGSKVVPLSELALEKAMSSKQAIRIEQWFELETANNNPKTSLVGTSPSSSTAARNPSVLVEISFSAPEVLDDSEDDMDDEAAGSASSKASYSKRASLKIRSQLKQEIKAEETKIEEPMLVPGIIDYICVVGARDIGDQKADDGARGWVNSTPECCILEQFPPDDDFHLNNGRSAVLPGKVEWFCFPDGCRLWRGLTPPNHDELNLKRFSASSPVHVSSSIAAFDACLGCTTSFSWFVIASNSDEYGSESKKTYGAVIRFYVPAPVGIDPTQDDFGQIAIEPAAGKAGEQSEAAKRLWVPLGICITSSLPIVGTMEIILLRLCEALSASGTMPNGKLPISAIQKSLASLIVNFQKPIQGAVSCSYPFLDGERLHISLPPRRGLPPLPHGNAIVSVCRLLGADGLNYLLAAFLTECKILLHSDDVANLSLVAEVLTSLLYPFQWSLPYVPVLPAEMMEFIEAPLSFLLGVPSCNMNMVDPAVLEDIVVVDLDSDFSTFFEGQSSGLKTKSPIPLPAAVASNISKAVYRLIRAVDELETSMDATNFPGMMSFPRIEPESLAEREFRLSVAVEICGLIRGFDECLVFSSSQPVFNVDKFLQTAPSIFEVQRLAPQANGQLAIRNAISPRSRRFLSILICCQHFHQFLEALESESLYLFHRVMYSLDSKNSRKETTLAGQLLSLDADKMTTELCKALQKMDDRTATYRVKSFDADRNTIDEKLLRQEPNSDLCFPFTLLRPIVLTSESKGDSGSDGVKNVSIEFFVELEKNPWRYQKLFEIKVKDESGNPTLPSVEKVKLREAIGDRRYRSWKSNLSYDKFDHDESSVFSDDSIALRTNFDVKSLITAATEESASIASTASGSGEEAARAERDILVLHRCLEAAIDTSHAVDEDLVSQAEDALQNLWARKFFLEVLERRSRSSANKPVEATSNAGRRTKTSGSAGYKLNSRTFEILIKLSFAMLDACSDAENFESAYALLKVTAGLYTTEKEGENDVAVVYVTERIGLHSVFANLNVWDCAKSVHINRKKLDVQNKSDGEKLDKDHDEYEAVVATLYEMNGYGIPAEELARFASRMCKEYGWYNSEKGQNLLMLAKRVCIRRDQGTTATGSTKVSDLVLMSPSPKRRKAKNSATRKLPAARTIFPDEVEWVETSWCHPAAQSSRRSAVVSPHNLAGKLDGNQSGGYMRRSAVTSLAYLGSSVVVTGGLDGGVFMARKIKLGTDSKQGENFGVRGVHLDWGSSGSRYTVGAATSSIDGEYGVGAVTCLATTRSSLGSTPRHSSSKDVIDALEDEEILEAMDGCRVVAGTTCGDLRVWSVKDVFSAVFFASRGGDTSSLAGMSASLTQRMGPSTAGGRNNGNDFAAGSSLTRLKFSLRGRALSGHRGGVSCIDVHSTFYRPDSIVSGGADGLIKLWSLRSPGTPSSGRRSSLDGGKHLSLQSSETLTPRSKAARSGDALSILSGHGGRVICVKTAWHGDRLLSGGADRTVRLWDLATSGGKCLNSLSGHFGWVTSVHYWGPNTIISASTDRSVALWDSRVHNSPLFTLRYHAAPVSDILVGPRTDPVIVTSASDGSIAAWDLRLLTGQSDLSNPANSNAKVAHKTQVVRNPDATLCLHHFNQRRRQQVCGPVRLSRGSTMERNTALCLGSDGVIREWDYKAGDGSGEVLNEYLTGHCDVISNFVSIAGDKVLDTQQLDSAGPNRAATTISTSWDGTVRMRHLVQNL